MPRAMRLVLVLGGLCFGASGCIAEIHEERLFGPTRAIAQSRSETIEERHDDETNPEGAACRHVTVTYPLVRDVTVRRFFADDAQTRNAALATLLGAGIAFLAYGTDQSACSATTGACPSFPVAVTAEAVLLAVAAVPIAFIAYNAVRVQDTRGTQYVTPAWTEGPWAPCKDQAPMSDQKAAAAP
jgi:hypothetical protein